MVFDEKNSTISMAEGEKIMENQILYWKTEMRKNIILEYYMITEEISAYYSTLKSYGVKISKIKITDGGGKVIESKQINNIFYRKEDAEVFLDIIMRNTVTPISLMDVTEDYIAESVERASQVTYSL